MDRDLREIARLAEAAPDDGSARLRLAQSLARANRRGEAIEAYWLAGALGAERALVSEGLVGLGAPATPLVQRRRSSVAPNWLAESRGPRRGEVVARTRLPGDVLALLEDGRIVTWGPDEGLYALDGATLERGARLPWPEHGFVGVAPEGPVTVALDVAGTRTGESVATCVEVHGATPRRRVLPRVVLQVHDVLLDDGGRAHLLVHDPREPLSSQQLVVLEAALDGQATYGLQSAFVGWLALARDVVALQLGHGGYRTVLVDTRAGTRIFERDFGTRGSVAFDVLGRLLVTAAPEGRRWKIIATERDGSLAWEQVLGAGTLGDRAAVVAPAPDGGCVAWHGDNLVRLDSSGRVVWERLGLTRGEKQLLVDREGVVYTSVNAGGVACLGAISPTGDVLFTLPFHASVIAIDARGRLLAKVRSLPSELVVIA